MRIKPSASNAIAENREEVCLMLGLMLYLMQDLRRYQIQFWKPPIGPAKNKHFHFVVQLPPAIRRKAIKHCAGINLDVLDALVGKLTHCDDEHQYKKIQDQISALAGSNSKFNEYPRADFNFDRF
jgi:hypothetical protein